MFNVKTKFNLKVFNEPEYSDDIVGFIPSGSILEVRKIYKNFINHQLGWSLYRHLDEWYIEDENRNTIEAIGQKSVENNKVEVTESYDRNKERDVKTILDYTNTISKLENKMNDFQRDKFRRFIVNGFTPDIDIITIRLLFNAFDIISKDEFEAFKFQLLECNKIVRSLGMDSNLKLEDGSNRRTFRSMPTTYSSSGSKNVSVEDVKKVGDHLLNSIKQVQDGAKKRAADEEQLTGATLDIMDLSSMVTTNDVVGRAVKGNLVYKDGVRPVNKIRGLFGAPSQYDEVSDPRYEKGNDIGHTYYNDILTKGSLLFLTPCLPSAMPGYSSADKEDFSKAFSGGDEGLLSGLLNDGGGGMYFKANIATKQYYKYFNTLCHLMAINLGIGNVDLGFGKLASANYQSFIDKNTSNFLGGNDTLGYYVDAIDSLNETFSNETSASELESKLNSVSDRIREAEFTGTGIFGEKTGSSINDKLSEWSSNIANEKKNWNWVKRFAGTARTLFDGGKMTIPNIWSDSTFNRSSNDFTLRIAVQNPCRVGWFIEAGVPMLSLIAMTASHNSDANSYTAPFLVRGFCRSSMNIDLGIISSLDIRKGAMGRWTADGLPTEVEINISIEDLYNSMSISNSLVSSGNNPQLLDYMANMAGLNINKPDISRAVTMVSQGVMNKFNPKLWIEYGIMGVTDHVNNIILKAWERIK